MFWTSKQSKETFFLVPQFAYKHSTYNNYFRLADAKPSQSLASNHASSESSDDEMQWFTIAMNYNGKEFSIYAKCSCFPILEKLKLDHIVIVLLTNHRYLLDCGWRVWGGSYANLPVLIPKEGKEADKVMRARKEDLQKLIEYGVEVMPTFLFLI